MRDGLNARALRIDVSDDASAAAAAETWRDRSPGRAGDGAGISTGWQGSSEETMDDVRAIYAVNVFGPIRTTKAFLPRLKASKAPRIVMISSSFGSLAWASDFDAPNAKVNLLG